MAETELILMIERCCRPALADHPGGHALGKKIRAAKIGRDQFVEALFAGFEHIGADARRDARIVDQNVEPAELRFDGQ